jgi:hypothetical protein
VSFAAAPGSAIQWASVRPYASGSPPMIMAWMSASVSRGRSTLDGVKVRGNIDPNEIEDRLS